MLLGSVTICQTASRFANFLGHSGQRALISVRKKNIGRARQTAPFNADACRCARNAHLFVVLTDAGPNIAIQSGFSGGLLQVFALATDLFVKTLLNQYR